MGRHSKPTHDIKGERFGRLVALEYHYGRWLCRCDCGQVTNALTGNLLRGNTRSCGCGQLEGLRKYNARMRLIMPNRFDYVKYDIVATTAQGRFKDAFMHLEEMAEAALVNGRAKELVLAKLEEAYMWIGKAIRDDQIARHGGSAELQESRGNG